MTSKPRTIDNLGLDASIRYARDKELFEAKYIEESQAVSKRTEIPVSKPYIPNEFDQLFSGKSSLLWASFSPPPEYFSFAKSLFSFQLIPSLGTYEQQEDSDRLEALKDALEREKENNPDSSDRERQQEEKEKKLIENLLECISNIDKSLNLINSRRNQYQRG